MITFEHWENPRVYADTIAGENTDKERGKPVISLCI